MRATRRSALALAITAAAFAASFGAPSGAQQLPTTVDARSIYDMPPDALERAFWLCDHRATVYGVDATPVAACTMVFEALKESRFGGDFGELLAWWQENKAVEHTKLDKP